MHPQGAGPQKIALPGVKSIVAVASGVAGDMTVWFLKDDRSSFDEGELHYGDQDSDSHTAPAVHR